MAIRFYHILFPLAQAIWVSRADLLAANDAKNGLIDLAQSRKTRDRRALRPLKLAQNMPLGVEERSDLAAEDEEFVKGETVRWDDLR